MNKIFSAIVLFGIFVAIEHYHESFSIDINLARIILSALFGALSTVLVFIIHIYANRKMPFYGDFILLTVLFAFLINIANAIFNLT